MRKINKAGFSMIEIVGVIVIVALLTVAGGLGIPRLIDNSRTDSTFAQLQVFASDTEAVLEDIGYVEFKPADTESFKASEIAQYINQLEADYSHAYFDRATLSITANGFQIATLDLQDPWGSPYYLIYNTNPAKGKPGACTFASPGPNMQLESAGYGSKDFADDILVIVDPK